MLFDNFDKKIKEAAEQHHPAYDENAWRKMESLLDEHLPRENNRRRFFLLLFTVLLIGGGAFLLLSKPHSRNSDLAVKPTNTSTNTSADSNNQPGATDKNTTTVSPNPENSDRDIAIDGPSDNAEIKIVDNGDNSLSVINKKSASSRNLEQKIGQNELPPSGVTSNNRDNGVPADQAANKDTQVLHAPVISQVNDQIRRNEPVADAATKQGQTTTNSQGSPADAATKTNPKKGRPRAMNGLSFFVAAGPDVSKAQNSKAGTVTMSWGLGVAYTLNRFTLRAGVFSVNKIYWAGPNDYKLSYTPPPSLKFMGADANCRVTEIPVKLSYNFAAKKKSNWFAGAGLSSYLMKREDYTYEYKSTTGSSYYHAYETKNENKHYFSILNMSGGYSYHLNKTISLSAEPYLEVPLTGIGVGKVHLNSGGVLFTLGVSPFRK